MSKDRAVGAIIVVVCVLVAVAFLGLLFFYPYISSFINLGSTENVQFWLIATPVTIALIAVLGIGAWIGYTMATAPPPKPIEEITNETETPTETKQQEENKRQP